MRGIGNLRVLGRLGRHARFYRRYGVVRPGELGLVLGLAGLTVFIEAGGMAMILPILSFVERGRDVAAFAESSTIAARIVEVFGALGLPVSLLTLSAIAFLMVLLRQGVNFLNMVRSDRLKWTVGRRVSVRVFRTVLASDTVNLGGIKPGQFSVLCDQESQATAAALRTYVALWSGLVAFLAYGAILLVASPLASLLALCVIGLVTGALYTLIEATRRLSSQNVVNRRDYVDFLNERFRAWKLIKLGNALEAEAGRAHLMASKIEGVQVGLTRISGLMLLIFVPVMVLFMFVTLYLFVDVLHLEISMVMLFVLVLLRLMPVSQGLNGQLNQLARFDPSIEMVGRMLAEARARRETDDGRLEARAVEREVVFDRVGFSYPDQEHAALRDVDVVIPAGRMTAVIGHSGAGKSTLVDLIPRLIEPGEGAIRIDGMDIREFSLASLRRLVAFVPQEPFLFNATIADNIRYLRPEASDDEVAEAARLANAAGFVEALPASYGTRLGEGGAGLSGGQKQRIVLARAFLSKAPLLVLDEPTSALDYESERAIQRVIETLVDRDDLTVVVIAHRLSTVRNAHQVIELEEGRVKRAGSADEILGRSEPAVSALR